MNTCPHCGRKLLSHISAKCNWCGAEIEDPAYLAQAEVERAALEADQARRDQQAVGFSSLVDGLGLLTGLSRPVLERQVVQAGHAAREHRQQPAVVVPAPSPVPAPEAPPAPPVSETQGRFEHLEL